MWCAGRALTCVAPFNTTRKLDPKADFDELRVWPCRVDADEIALRREKMSAFPPAKYDGMLDIEAAKVRELTNMESKWEN